MTTSQGGAIPVYDYNPVTEIDATDPANKIITQIYKGKTYQMTIATVGSVKTFSNWEEIT